MPEIHLTNTYIDLQRHIKTTLLQLLKHTPRCFQHSNHQKQQQPLLSVLVWV